MLKFLFGVAFGAAGYWAWQSFGRDLLGMGSDQETTYGGFSSGTGSTSSFNSGTGSTGSTYGSGPTSTGAGATGGSGSTGSTSSTSS